MKTGTGFERARQLDGNIKNIQSFDIH